ncbi:MAG TPA: NAD(P)H-dependent oxidoreductase [Nevskiaceae bacterium]|nr:NAD(P)H-dependent oxidoreductase [Nevskiaceae bacterium]
MRRLLLIHHSQSGRTARLEAAVAAGVAACEERLALRRRLALQASLEDLFWAEGLLIGTPENFGYLSGAVKDFLDRTYYPAEGRTVGLPWAMFVSAGNDGRGAVAALERIATGYRWKRVAEPLIVRGEPAEADLAAARELGLTLATGLALGLY